MMQETEEPCPYPRASLSARNLLRSPFQQQPIASNVQKFVADQQRYLRRHAKDGVATAEEWGRVAQGESLETQNTTMRRALPPSQRAILLSSPILTALVPEAQPIRNTIIRLPNRKHSLPHSTLISAYTAYPAPGSQNIAVRLTSKRKECPDLQNVAGHPPLHEDELRLEERRHRRRAKRAMLAPPKPPSAVIGSPDHSADAESASEPAPTVFTRGPAKAKQNKKLTAARGSNLPGKCKDRTEEPPLQKLTTRDKENSTIRSERSPRPERKKRAKLAPGVALMQNFQAKNIPKGRRITIASRVGVFNKGVASARIEMKSKRSSKSGKSGRRPRHDNIFNEREFLNRTRLPPLSSILSDDTEGSSISGASVRPRHLTSKPASRNREASQKPSRCHQITLQEPHLASDAGFETESDFRPENRSPSKKGQHVIKLNTDKKSRFFSARSTHGKKNSSPATLATNYEASDLKEAKDISRPRGSSPPWEIDWAAEGLSEPRTDSDGESSRGADGCRQVSEHDICQSPRRLSLPVEALPETIPVQTPSNANYRPALDEAVSISLEPEQLNLAIGNQPPGTLSQYSLIESDQSACLVDSGNTMALLPGITTAHNLFYSVSHDRETGSCLGSNEHYDNLSYHDNVLEYAIGLPSNTHHHSLHYTEPSSRRIRRHVSRRGQVQNSIHIRATRPYVDDYGHEEAFLHADDAFPLMDETAWIDDIEDGYHRELEDVPPHNPVFADSRREHGYTNGDIDLSSSSSLGDLNTSIQAWNDGVPICDDAQMDLYDIGGQFPPFPISPISQPLEFYDHLDTVNPQDDMLIGSHLSRSNDRSYNLEHLRSFDALEPSTQVEPPRKHQDTLLRLDSSSHFQSHQSELLMTNRLLQSAPSPLLSEPGHAHAPIAARVMQSPPSTDSLAMEPLIPDRFQQGRALLLGVDPSFSGLVDAQRDRGIPRGGSEATALRNSVNVLGSGSVEEVQLTLARELEQNGYWARSGSRRR